MAKKSTILKNPPSISSGKEEEEITPQPQTPKSLPIEKPQSSTKPVAALSPPPALTKRPRQSSDENVKSSKRAKVGDNFSKKLGDAKKGWVWSEEDESALLNGVIKFEKQFKMKVNEDMNGFVSFLDGSFSGNKVDFLPIEIKLHELENKFLSIKVKDGARPKFTNNHEQYCFDLSMKIWANYGNLKSVGGLAGVKSRTLKKSSSTDVGGVNKLDSYIVLGLEATKNRKQGNGKRDDKQVNGQVEVERPLGVTENAHKAATYKTDSLQLKLSSCKSAASVEEMVINGWGILQGEKKTELEDKWTKYHVDRLELYLKSLDLLKEQAMLLLEKMKSSWMGKV